jgi:hypothetical protein
MLMLTAILTRKSSALLPLHKSGKSVAPADTFVKYGEMRRHQSKYRMLAVRIFCRDHHPMCRTLFHSYDISRGSFVHSLTFRQNSSAWEWAQVAPIIHHLGTQAILTNAAAGNRLQ